MIVILLYMVDLSIKFNTIREPDTLNVFSEPYPKYLISIIYCVDQKYLLYVAIRYNIHHQSTISLTVNNTIT